MALELIRGGGERVAEVFEDDVSKQHTFSLFVEGPVPIEPIDWLIAEAKARL